MQYVDGGNPKTKPYLWDDQKIYAICCGQARLWLALHGFVKHGPGPYCD
jgi:hypothetical protein